MDEAAYLVVSRAEDELGVGIVVQDALDNLTLCACQHLSSLAEGTNTHLVDSDRAHFQILFSNEHCIKRSSAAALLHRTKVRTFYRTLARKVVLKQVLALMALEQTAQILVYVI